MENIMKKALDQIKADDNLKQKTTDYVLNARSNVISMNSAAKKKPVYTKRLVAAACAAVVLCALPIGGYAYYKTPTSYVSVDINPSVELGINAFGKVVTIKAFNTDGERVLLGLSLMDTNVESAVREIVKSASRSGFIKDDGSTFISVTAETNSGEKAEQLKEEAKTGAEDAVETENDKAMIETANIALDRRDDALALGITPGKLNLIQKLQALDPTIKTEDYKDASVTEIQKKYVELKKEHNGKNDKDDTETASSSPDTSPSPSPSISPNPSPSAPISPAGPAKPGNGNHNGSGNGKKDDDSVVNASPDSSDNEDTGGGSSPNTPQQHGNNGSNTGNGNNGNSEHGKDNNGKGNG